MSKPRLSQRFALSDIPSDVFCVRVSPDDAYLACACADGSVRVYSTSTGVLTYSIPASTSTGEVLPLTCLRWRPATGSSRTRNVLLTASADGSVRHVHVSSSRVLSRSTPTGDAYYALDLNRDGSLYATGGREKSVTVWDEETHKAVQVLTSSGVQVAGHSNRIFSVKFVPELNCLVSGGWDNSVILWDLRSGASVKSWYGPHIAGDSVDVHDLNLLTGSWSSEKQVAVFDLRASSLTPLLEMNLTSKSTGSSTSTPLLYTVGWHGRGGLFAVGGSGCNEARLYDATRTVAGMDGSSSPVPTPTHAGTVAGLTRAVYSLHFDGGEGLAIAGGDFLYYFDINYAGGATSTVTGGGRTTSTVVTTGAAESPPAAAPAAPVPMPVDDEAMLAMYGGEEEEPGKEEDDLEDAATPAAAASAATAATSS